MSVSQGLSARMLQFAIRLVLLLLLLTPITACQPQPETTPTTTSRIVYGLTLSPGGFDPHRNESSELGIPMRQVYDTLIYRNPADGGFVPGLATDWSISEDRRTYTFNLRQDVHFHDGTPFNALAVAATLDRIVDPETRSTKALALLGPYVGYQPGGEYTISIILNEPYSPLLDSLSQVYLGIASPTALAEYADEPERYQFHQVGTGPYQMVDLILDRRLVLRRNPDYAWGPSFYQPPADATGVPIEEIEFRFFSDAATRFTALESGDAQIMGEIPPLQARTQSGSSQLQILPASVPGQPLQFLVNTQQAPTNSLRFRQALLYATNRSAIIDLVFQGLSPVAWGPITSTTQYYNPAMNGTYAYNLEQAVALLTTEGYTDSDRNGYLDNPAGGDLEVQMLVPPWGSVPQVAQVLQDQWSRVGIRAVLTPVPDFSTLLAQVESGAYNLVAFYTFGIDPAFLSSFYTTGGTRNWTGFANAELDSLLFDAQRQLEPGTRAALYGRAQQIIMDNVLILPIREYVNLNGVSRQIEGLTFDRYGWFPLLANARLKPASGSVATGGTP